MVNYRRLKRRCIYLSIFLLMTGLSQFQCEMVGSRVLAPRFLNEDLCLGEVLRVYQRFRFLDSRLM